MRNAEQYTKKDVDEITAKLAIIKAPLALVTTSSAMMITQIVLTRILSIFLHYYFVYILISITILGLGIGGFITYWLLRKGYRFNPTNFLLIAGVVTILIVILFAFLMAENLWYMYLLVSCVLFILVGIFSSSLFSMMTERSSILYWADLSGAALGVFTAIFLMNYLGGINALLLAAILWFISAYIFSPSRNNKSNIFIISAVFLLILNHMFGFVDIALGGAQTSKTIGIALNTDGLNGEIIYSYWDAYARTDVVAYSEYPNELTIFVDGGAGSSVFDGRNGLKNLSYLREDLGYFPFGQFKPNNVLVIGPGGGKDILLAQLAEVSSITAVEINAGIIHALDAVSDFSGNFHRHSSVQITIEDGRSYIKSNQQNYDLINLSLVANEAADLAGMSLSENYLYTQEAFTDYFSRLNPGGVLAIRLHDEPHLQRAFITALFSMASDGLSTSEAMRRIIVLVAPPHPSSPAFLDPLLLVFESHIEPDLAMTLYQNIKINGITPLFIPGVVENMPYAAFNTGGLDIKTYVSRLPVNSFARPTTDDRPFFYMLNSSLPSELVTVSLITSICASVWSIYLINKSKNLKAIQAHNSNYLLSSYWWIYFALLGIGFMLLEISLIQRFTLYLGHPVRSLSVVLGGLLISAGIGSYVSNNFASEDFLPVIRKVIFALVILGLFYCASLPQILGYLQGESLSLRILVSLILIFPLGMLLGIPFPIGLRILSIVKTNIIVPLALVTNGIFSVLGSVLSMTIAIQAGFTIVWISGLITYFIIIMLTWGPLKNFVYCTTS